MTGHLFLDMPNSVARRIFEMQMQFATRDVHPLLTVQVRQWNNHAVDNVNNVPCGGKSTRAKSFGLKGIIRIDLVALIV
jgi:hypothetical protein